jgi:hypothetical protein
MITVEMIEMHIRDQVQKDISVIKEEMEKLKLEIVQIKQELQERGKH